MNKNPQGLEKENLIRKFVRDGEKFLKEEYNLELNIPIRINNRLSRTLGRYFPASKYIEMSGHFSKNNNYDFVLKVLKHELVHYAFHLLGRDYKDGTKEFEDELYRLELPSNHNTEFFQSYNRKPKKHYGIDCVNDQCSRSIRVVRRNITSSHVCGVCGSGLKIVDTFYR